MGTAKCPITSAANPKHLKAQKELTLDPLKILIKFASLATSAKLKNAYFIR